MRNKDFDEYASEIVNLEPVKDREMAYKILMALYSSIHEMADYVHGSQGEEADSVMFKIFHVMKESPLHHLIIYLASDDQVPICGAARAWIDWLYPDDPEAKIVLDAVHRVNFVWETANQLLEEMYGEPYFAELLRLWELAVEEDSMPQLS